MGTFSASMYMVNHIYQDVSDVSSDCADFAMGNLFSSETIIGSIGNFILDLIPGWPIISNIISFLTNGSLIEACGEAVAEISKIFLTIKTVISFIGGVILIYYIRGTQ